MLVEEEAGDGGCLVSLLEGGRGSIGVGLEGEVVVVGWRGGEPEGVGWVRGSSSLDLECVVVVVVVTGSVEVEVAASVAL